MTPRGFWYHHCRSIISSHIDFHHLISIITIVKLQLLPTISSLIISIISSWLILSPSQPFWPFEEYDSRRHPNCQPHLDYLAPEYALTHTLDTAADLFPLGVLTYALFNEGRPIFHNNQDFGTFKRNCCEVSTVLLFCFGKLISFGCVRAPSNFCWNCLFFLFVS